MEQNTKSRKERKEPFVFQVSSEEHQGHHFTLTLVRPLPLGLFCGLRDSKLLSSCPRQVPHPCSGGISSVPVLPCGPSGSEFIQTPPNVKSKVSWFFLQHSLLGGQPGRQVVAGLSYLGLTPGLVYS